MFSQSRVATGQDRAVCLIFYTVNGAFKRYGSPSQLWGFRVAINLMHPNLQFGVLAAVWWFLAGQDLKAFQVIEDLVGSSLQFIL